MREFFRSENFLEVETPVRIKSPAPETHIDPIRSEDHFLRTSPELQMKQMLSAGFAKIFQIGPCFRKNETGKLHSEEFTMLEWYESGADYLSLIGFTKEMLVFVSESVFHRDYCEFHGGKIKFSGDWEIFTVEEAFAKFADLSAFEAAEKDMFDEILVTQVENRLPKDRPVILMDYPAKFAAFARLKDPERKVAERWELYLGGIEIANAYGELTDFIEQKKRFDVFTEERKMLGKESPAHDENFLKAVSHGLPESAGCALGFDRLVMILTDSPEIASVR